MVRYQSKDGSGVLVVGDNRTMPMIAAGSVGVILTSPPYWIRGTGRPSASRYATRIATEHGREWLRVLKPRGELWLIMGDRHDGREWIAMDALVADSLRQKGWSFQGKGFWIECPSSLRWDDQINYLLRFIKAGIRSLPPKDPLCLHLPIPWSPSGSLWDAMPPAVVEKILNLAPTGRVLDPYFGSGAVGAVAARMGRQWIGIEWDRGQAKVAARHLHLERIVSRKTPII